MNAIKSSIKKARLGKTAGLIILQPAYHQSAKLENALAKINQQQDEARFQKDCKQLQTNLMQLQKDRDTLGRRQTEFYREKKQQNLDWKKLKMSQVQLQKDIDALGKRQTEFYCRQQQLMDKLAQFTREEIEQCWAWKRIKMSQLQLQKDSDALEQQQAEFKRRLDDIELDLENGPLEW